MMPERVRDAARAFLDALDPDQLRRARLPLADETERRTWYYWPAPRAGLDLGAMTPPQQELAHRIVAEVTSPPAFAKIQAIIALERVLDEAEGRTGAERGLPRDPTLYHVTVFGSPSDAVWGFRFEGHHVSVHVTMADDEIAATPFFLGANPAVVDHDGRVVVRPLGEEEDCARDLLLSLDARQRSMAVVSEDAPDDILTTNLARIDHIPHGGLSAKDMGSEQLELLEQLISVYLERVRSPLSGLEAARLKRSGAESISFAWAGSDRPGERHYYRVTGPTFLVEYDNTQDDANHVHAVWRDAERDFGTDLLRRHLSRDHAGDVRRGGREA